MAPIGTASSWFFKKFTNNIKKIPRVVFRLKTLNFKHIRQIQNFRAWGAFWRPCAVFSFEFCHLQQYFLEIHLKCIIFRKESTLDSIFGLISSVLILKRRGQKTKNFRLQCRSHPNSVIFLPKSYLFQKKMSKIRIFSPNFQFFAPICTADEYFDSGILLPSGMHNGGIRSQCI